jgi:hypothetical protein
MLVVLLSAIVQQSRDGVVIARWAVVMFLWRCGAAGSPVLGGTERTTTWCWETILQHSGRITCGLGVCPHAWWNKAGNWIVMVAYPLDARQKGGKVVLCDEFQQC